MENNSINTNMPADGPSMRAAFFGNLALKNKDAFRLHKEYGLLDINPDTGEKDWRNVSEHCLVEIARVQEIGTLLNLGQGALQDLTTATALHDFYKKQEKEIVVSNGLNWEAFEQANTEADNAVEKAGFSENVRWLFGSVGHSSLIKMEEILAKPAEDVSDAEISALILHYVDDYTSGTDPATAGSFEARMKKNEANPRYSLLNDQGKEFFDGKTTFQKQREVGVRVEALLEQLVMSRSGVRIREGELPILIDELIVKRIASYGV